MFAGEFGQLGARSLVQWPSSYEPYHPHLIINSFRGREIWGQKERTNFKLKDLTSTRVCSLLLVMTFIVMCLLISSVDLGELLNVSASVSSCVKHY